MTMKKPLWDQDTWKNIWVLTLFHALAHKALTLPGNQEADALAQI